MNQDGTTAGITAPNPAAQTEVIETAWKDAGIAPETLSFIEAHGTGTKLEIRLNLTGFVKHLKSIRQKNNFVRLVLLNRTSVICLKRQASLG